jgi:single-strand DNA-binding protein
MSFRPPLDSPTPNPIRWPRLRWGRKENQMNSMTLVGVLTKDPRQVGGGERRGARMRLAEANAHPDHPLYIDASIFGAQAEACLEHLRKGSRVAVVGRLRFREWKRVDLSPRSEHWIAADRVDFLSTPPAQGPAEDTSTSSPSADAAEAPAPA